MGGIYQVPVLPCSRLCHSDEWMLTERASPEHFIEIKNKIAFSTTIELRDQCFFIAYQSIVPGTMDARLSAPGIHLMDVDLDFAIQRCEFHVMVGGWRNVLVINHSYQILPYDQ